MPRAPVRCIINILVTVLISNTPAPPLRALVVDHQAARVPGALDRELEHHGVALARGAVGAAPLEERGVDVERHQAQAVRKHLILCVCVGGGGRASCQQACIQQHRAHVCGLCSCPCGVMPRCDQLRTPLVSSTHAHLDDGRVVHDEHVLDRHRGHLGDQDAPQRVGDGGVDADQVKLDGLRARA